MKYEKGSVKGGFPIQIEPQVSYSGVPNKNSFRIKIVSGQFWKICKNSKPNKNSSWKIQKNFLKQQLEIAKIVDGKTRIQLKIVVGEIKIVDENGKNLP